MNKQCLNSNSKVKKGFSLFGKKQNKLYSMNDINNCFNELDKLRDQWLQTGKQF